MKNTSQDVILILMDLEAGAGSVKKNIVNRQKKTGG